jgi:hypothetical protein
LSNAEAAEAEGGSYRARSALLALVLAAALPGMLWLVVHEGQRAWQGAERVPVVLANEHYRVTTHQLNWLRDFSVLHFGAGKEDARALVEAEVDVRLAQIFAGVQARLPAFADWYYSLGGEYSRMGMAVLAGINLANGGFVADRAATMLFPDGVWQRELTVMDHETLAHLRVHQEAVRAAWLHELTSRLAHARVPAPLPAPLVLPGDDRAQELLRLDRLVQQLATREQDALQTRMTVSAAAASGAAAGSVLWRAAGRRATAAGARAVAARGAGRGAARAGTAAAGGAAVCAPGGPAAIGCALAAGAAAWLATDWTLLKIDEALHREALLDALESSLGELQEAMRHDILAAYDAMIAGHYDAVQDDIRNGFVPARSISASGSQVPNG